jgi:hypothetical protein
MWNTCNTHLKHTLATCVFQRNITLLLGRMEAHRCGARRRCRGWRRRMELVGALTESLCWGEHLREAAREALGEHLREEQLASTAAYSASNRAPPTAPLASGQQPCLASTSTSSWWAPLADKHVSSRWGGESQAPRCRDEGEREEEMESEKISLATSQE